MSGLKKDTGTIKRAIQIMAGAYDKDLLSYEVAKVTSVDTANWLCNAQLVSGTVQTLYTNIQLTAEKASNGFIQVPKVGSNVILAITWRNEVYVFMCSEVDAFVFNQKNSDGSYEEFVINCNSGFNSSLPVGIQIIDGGGNGVVISSKGIITFNDGSYNGLLIGANVTQKINNLETTLNNLMNLISTWVPVANDGGAALKSKLAGWVTQTLTLTQESDLENADVTHGPSVS